jgi:hypothetical protein
MDPRASQDASELRHLAAMALRAIATARTRRAQYETVRTRQAAEMDRSEYLLEQHRVLLDALRGSITALARAEREAGHSAVEMIHLLHDIVDDAPVDCATKREVERQVVEWGIDAYYAA